MNVSGPVRDSIQATAQLSIPDEAKILSFNVGHGDCTLVEYWRARVLSFRCLVDAGLSLPPTLLEHLRRNRRADNGPDIDVLVLSHVDSDHQGGMPALLTPDIRIGEYWGPCLPTFERLASLFHPRVQTAVAKARKFERKLDSHDVPIVYPLEGFSSSYAGGRVTLSVLSPAARLIEKLSTARGGELANLLMHQPLPLDWLQVAELDTQDNDDGSLRALFRQRSSVFPNDFPNGLPTSLDVDKISLHAAAASSAEVTEPDFFGNSVLNDTSLIIAIDVQLDDIRRKRILLTGDQENWSYLAARHSGGLGPDVLKAPHHGGRVYLRDRQISVQDLYLWLRPRSVIVSASGKHSLPRLTFRDSVRAIGATLFCPNLRGIEPMTAGTVEKTGGVSCFEAFACSVPKSGQCTTISLNAHDERADSYACVQGTLHTAPAPIVVIRQEILSPCEKTVRYTWGELERNARWIQAELEKRHRDFCERAPFDTEFFATRVRHQKISWNSILPAARAAGMHQLAVDPGPVFSFARAHRRFWSASPEQYGREEIFLYRSVTDSMLDQARNWLSRVPRMLLHASLTHTQVINGDRLDILQSAEWEVFDGLLSGLLALPKEVIADEVRPSLLPMIAESYTARACSAKYPNSYSPLEANDRAFVWLERDDAKSKFPNLSDKKWADLWTMNSQQSDSHVSWSHLKELATKDVLLGNYFTDRGGYGEQSWLKNFSTSHEAFDERFKAANWTPMWKGKEK